MAWPLPPAPHLMAWPLKEELFLLLPLVDLIKTERKGNFKEVFNITLFINILKGVSKNFTYHIYNSINSSTADWVKNSVWTLEKKRILLILFIINS